MSRNTSINRLARGGPDGGVLGLECGGTRSTAAFADSSGALLSTRDFGPANLRLLSDDALVRHFRVIARAFPQPKAVGIGMAGARTSADRYRIRTAAQQVWPATPCTATSDLEIALAADSRHANETRVLVLSGTGSCCFGQAPDGRTAKIGGWGHLLGDKGSGYDIGLRALKAAVFYLDRDGAWTTLGQRIIAALQLNEPNDLIDWVQGATKTEIAALTIEVFAAAQSGDRIARDVLVGAAATLASDAVACSARLARRGMHVRFFLAGSILICQPAFARKVAREIRALRRKAVVSNLTTPGVMGP